MRPTIRIGLTIALASLVLAGCSDENSKVRGQFIAGCVQAGTPKSLCACTFEKLEKKYPSQALNQLNTPGRTPPDSFMRDVMQFAQACQQE